MIPHHALRGVSDPYTLANCCNIFLRKEINYCNTSVYNSVYNSEMSLLKLFLQSSRYDNHYARSQPTDIH